MKRNARKEDGVWFWSHAKHVFGQLSAAQMAMESFRVVTGRQLTSSYWQRNPEDVELVFSATFRDCTAPSGDSVCHVNSTSHNSTCLKRNKLWVSQPSERFVWRSTAESWAHQNIHTALLHSPQKAVCHHPQGVRILWRHLTGVEWYPDDLLHPLKLWSA